MDTTFYRDNGYIVIKDFIDKKLLDEVKNDAETIFKIQLKRLGIINSFQVTEEEFENGLFKLFNKDLQTLIFCGKQVQHLISLHRLALNDTIINTLKTLGIAFPIINVRPTLFFNHRKLSNNTTVWKKPPHQDWRTTQGSLDSMIIWVPLMDIYDETGPLEIIPESHKLGLLNYKYSDNYHVIDDQQLKSDNFISVELKKGDALFFSTLLIHRSGNNTSEKIRWSCHFRYNNLNDQSFIERGFPHSYIYGPMEELITPDFPDENTARAFFSQTQKNI